jgi:aminotransferase
MVSARVKALEPSIIREMYGKRRPTSIDLSIGEPAIRPDQDLLDAAWARFSEGPAGYTPNPGLPELREAIAAHHRLPGRDRADNVIVTVGSEEAVYLSMLSVLDPGDEILVPDPGYPAYRGIARLLGVVPVPFAIERATGLVHRRAAIEAALTPRTRAIVLNGPSNPFGTVDSAAELAAIAQLASERGITVLSDEIYRDLYYGSAPPSIAPMLESSIFIAGLSKSCAMTGLRLGYLIAEAELVKKATLAHQLLVTCASRIAQLAALEVFRAPESLRAHIGHYEAARRALLEAARELPSEAEMHLGEGAFYAILDVSRWVDPKAPMELALALLDQEDVVAVPGIAFSREHGAWFWRLSYAAGDEAAGEGLRRIARFLKKR